ncbi:hypothetical protein Tco_0125763, partial [Tanacetum coccineum]
PPPAILSVIGMTRGQLALASRRHVSTRGWSVVTVTVVGATDQRRPMTVNGGEPPLNHREPPLDHRSTVVGPPPDRRWTTIAPLLDRRRTTS